MTCKLMFVHQANTLTSTTWGIALSLSLSHTHTHTHTFIHMHTMIHTHAHTYIHKMIHIQPQTNTHKDIDTHKVTDRCTHTHTHKHKTMQKRMILLSLSSNTEKWCRKQTDTLSCWHFPDKLCWLIKVGTWPDNRLTTLANVITFRIVSQADFRADFGTTSNISCNNPRMCSVVVASLLPGIRSKWMLLFCVSDYKQHEIKT